MADLFRAILIETRNVCNRKCWFCKFGQEREDPSLLQMSWDTILRILQNLKELDYAGRISWYNINEPLSDRRMLQILKTTREYCPRAFLSFATNGDLLTETLYAQLKDHGLDALGVSIYDDATYARIAPMEDNHMVLIDMRSPGPGILENRGGSIQQEQLSLIGDGKRYADRSCERPFEMMVVNPEGRVVLCCADMYYDVVMGDVSEQRLEQIWNNDPFKHYRHSLRAEGRRNLKLCDKCSFSGEGFRPYFPFSAERKHKTRWESLRSRARRLNLA